MLRRPVDPRFSQAVLEGRKFTTIREKPWPVRKPIMLYNWTGAPYRSKQRDVAAIVVQGFWPIEIAHHADGSMTYSHGMENVKPLHETEGFPSREAMDEWFRKIVKPGQIAGRTLMRFRLAHPQEPKPEAVRCSEAWDIPWPGHGNAVLRRHHCRNKTTHPSGKCHLHR